MRVSPAAVPATTAGYTTNPTTHQNAYHPPPLALPPLALPPRPQNGVANSHPYGMHMHQNPYHPPQNTFAHGHPYAQVPVAPAPAAGITPCVDGGPHDFHDVTAQNEKKSLAGGVQAMFIGTGGGAEAKNSSDKGQRVILYCRKCCKKEIA